MRSDRIAPPSGTCVRAKNAHGLILPVSAAVVYYGPGPEPGFPETGVARGPAPHERPETGRQPKPVRSLPILMGQFSASQIGRADHASLRPHSLARNRSLRPGRRTLSSPTTISDTSQTGSPVRTCGSAGSRPTTSASLSEQSQTGNSWECRWDRHPNDHNTRDHYHPPPDAPTPGEDADFPNEWRDVLSTVLSRLDNRIKVFWNE